MKVVSFRGNNINDGTNYVGGVLMPALGLPKVSVEQVGRLGRWPVVSGVGRPGRTLVLSLTIVGSDWDAGQAELASWFDPEDETPGQLIVSDNDGSSLRYVMAICEQLVEEDGSAGNDFLAVMVIDGDPRWRSVTADSVAWSVTSSGDTETISNLGTDLAFPVFTIEPTSVKTGGYAYRRSLFIRWRLDIGAVKYPVDVVDNGLDTGALLADTTRSVQVNQGGGINASVTTIPYDTEVGTFPSSGLAYVGTEQIAYTGKTGTDLTGVTRGVNGTTAASHADNAVIAASKVQADGDDLRVLVDGVEADRWLQDFGTSTCQVWVNLDFVPQGVALLEAAIAGSGDVDTIDVVSATAGELVGDISAFPAAGALMIGSECFVYTGKNDALGRFLGVTRAARGTSMASHSAEDTVWWVQHDIRLVYGNPDDGAPTVKVSNEPAFALTSSNEAWDYAATFGADGGLHAGSWVIQEQIARPPGQTLDFYTDDQFSVTSPWDVVGIRVRNLKQTLAPHRGRWAVYNPCGIVEVDVAGKVWVERDVDEWYGEVQSSVDGFKWAASYVVVAPTTTETYENWNQSNLALTSGAKWLGLMLRVADGMGARDDRRLEMSTAVLELDTDYTPVVSMGAEEGNYSLACRITNNATGDAIDVSFVMDLNGELEIDTDLKTVTYLDDGSSQFQALSVVGGARRNWLALAPGDNELQFDDVGSTGLTVTVEWRGRFYQ